MKPIYKHHELVFEEMRKFNDWWVNKSLIVKLHVYSHFGVRIIKNSIILLFSALWWSITRDCYLKDHDPFWKQNKIQRTFKQEKRVQIKTFLLLFSSNSSVKEYVSSKNNNIINKNSYRFLLDKLNIFYDLPISMGFLFVRALEL